MRDATTESSPTTVIPYVSSAQVSDGTNLRTLHWPADGDPVATALIVHGLGEHAGRYDSVALPLAAAGIDVHAYDHRGFGGSGGPRSHVERWGILHDDLEERLVALRAAAPDRPVLMYGHSLGGLIACGYVLADPARPLPDLLVLSAPALADDQPGWQRPLAALLSGIVPKMHFANGLPRGGLSRDPAVDEAVANDPLSTSSSSVRFGAEAFREQDRVNAVLATIDAMPAPTYVFHGSADPIVPIRATVPFEGKGNVERHVHDGLRHECHHEPEQEHVLAEVVAWIGAQGVPVRGLLAVHHEDAHDEHHEAHHDHAPVEV
jgi:alpha-beta hydrolase superfamily lysophospholipase